ncbi:ABC transporter permease [Hoeflea sp. G2-23]|uniref:ABC transporter permease n=1 Tax=Hoeflea algicola TaxID=2983763 RepID=A0ABT3ZF05_9HYPH|nr:ABC transporter permease [Hoeflea algicola]MCY0150385.1 ABC transporter permease [Hoeflea algicola]
MTAEPVHPEDTLSLGAEMAAARRRRWRQLAGRLLSHRSFSFGLVILAIFVFVALSADLIAPYEPSRSDYRSILMPPSYEHWFGTDSFGRDIASRIIYGTRVSLRIGLIVVLTTGILGTLLGTLASYVRWLDSLIMRTLDGLMAFPGVLLAIALAAALGPSEINAIIALTVTFTPRTARIVRASVLVVQGMQFIEAAHAVGASHARIIFRYILANALSPLIVQLTFVFAVSIVAEAILSFLGVGPPPPAPSLGNIIADGRTYIQEAWWIAVFPGIAIAVAVLSLNLMGDGLRDIIDPRQRNLRGGA